jgi:hypothetical protein
MMTLLCIGYFQSEEGQFGCISCDSLGDFFQQSQGQTSCQACPTGTQRYIGVLSARNRSSCQCKEGATLKRRGRRRRLNPQLRACVRAGYYSRHAQAGEVRSSFKPLARFISQTLLSISSACRHARSVLLEHP